MLLSIVIPTYNRSVSLKKNLSELKRCIGTTPDVEVFIIDDCSNDNHKQVNRSLCENLEFHYHWLPQNRGPAHARNVGINKSKGEWVAFLDDDVYVDKQWLLILGKAIARAGKDILGIEGKTKSAGTSLWDSEVENLSGGQFLSCHIIYRRDVLIKVGGFDEKFSGPFAEDHELACRIKKWGDVFFEKELMVYHMSRNIKLIRYCKESFRRMRMLLDAELYFYMKHKDRYHTFRHAATFWNGLLTILFKHGISTFRRRRIITLLLNPLQTIALMISSILEQAAAWIYLPRYVAQFLNNNKLSIDKDINWDETAKLWNFKDKATVSVLQFSPNIIGSLLFRMQKAPVYDANTIFNKTKLLSSSSSSRIFIRIDDVFLHDRTVANQFCTCLKGNKIPFLASVTGNDLLKNENSSVIRAIIDCGGAIGVHGFSHSGRFGPYESEILQLSFPQLDKLNASVLEAGHVRNFKPIAFIPPFNAIFWEQIVYLGRSYHIICGGPETVRFTEFLYGPVVLNNGSLYFPCCQPFYGSSAAMINPKFYKTVMNAHAPLCLTFHFHKEAEDNFKSLVKCFQLFRDTIKEWHTLYKYDTSVVKDV